jgi:hypothetical protein
MLLLRWLLRLQTFCLGLIIAICKDLLVLVQLDLQFPQLCFQLVAGYTCWCCWPWLSMRGL